MLCQETNCTLAMLLLGCVQAQARAKQDSLEEQIASADAAAAEARSNAEAVAAEAASLAEERHGQLALVMDSLAALQARLTSKPYLDAKVRLLGSSCAAHDAQACVDGRVGIMAPKCGGRSSSLHCWRQSSARAASWSAGKSCIPFPCVCRTSAHPSTNERSLILPP